MPSYTISYFDLRGRAEPARLIMEQAGVKFKEVRVAPPFGNDQQAISAWKALKPSLPFGTFPLLQVDDVTIAESLTIYSFLGREHGLAGKNNLEAAKAEEVGDVISSAIEKQYHYYFDEEDKAKKELLEKKYVDEVLPTLLNNLERRLVKSGGEYFAGGSLSWADIMCYHYVYELKTYNINYQPILDKAPKVKALVGRVGELPRIKSWVQRRPVTDF